MIQINDGTGWKPIFFGKKYKPETLKGLIAAFAKLQDQLPPAPSIEGFLGSDGQWGMPGSGATASTENAVSSLASLGLLADKGFYHTGEHIYYVRQPDKAVPIKGAPLIRPATDLTIQQSGADEITLNWSNIEDGATRYLIGSPEPITSKSTNVNLIQTNASSYTEDGVAGDMYFVVAHYHDSHFYMGNQVHISL